MTNDWISDYYLFNLVPTLTDLGASDPEISRLLTWFKKTAPEWVDGCATMKDFASYTRSRLRIKLGQTVTKASFAMRIIDALFRDEDSVTLKQVLDAVVTLVPTQPFPFEVKAPHETAIINLGEHTMLCDKTFFEEILKPLYPFELSGKVSVIKRIPLGEGAERKIDLLDLAFWYRFPNYDKVDRQRAKALHSSDRLDWSRKNLYSRHEEGILHWRHQERIDPSHGHDDNSIVPSVHKDRESQRDTPEAIAARKMRMVPHGTKHDQIIYLPEDSRHRADWDTAGAILPEIPA
jgi:hypothetical protein